MKSTSTDDDSRWKANVLDSENGQILNQFAVPTGSYTVVPLISPDGKYVAASLTGSQVSENVKVAVWNISTAELHAEFEIQNGVPVAWSPNSNRLLVSAYGELTQLDLVSRKALWTASFPEGFETARMRDLLIRGDGKRILAVSHKDNAWILNADDGQPLAQFSRFPYGAIAWSADARSIVTCDQSGRVDLWNASRLEN